MMEPEYSVVNLDEPKEQDSEAPSLPNVDEIPISTATAVAAAPFETEGPYELTKRPPGLVWLIGQLFAAFTIFVSVLVHVDWGMWSVGRVCASVFAPITMGLVIFAISWAFKERKDPGEHCAQIGTSIFIPVSLLLNGFLMLWWFVLACLFTSSGPFTPREVNTAEMLKYHRNEPRYGWEYNDHWDGFFACWAGVICSVKTLSAVLRDKNGETTDVQDHDSFEFLLYLFISTVVQLIANIKTTATSRVNLWNVFSLIVSTVTFAAFFALCGAKLDEIKKSIRAKVLIAVLTTLWTTLAFTITIWGPFADGHNGFWSAWCGCLLLLHQAMHFVPSRRQLLLSFGGQILAAITIFLATCAGSYIERGHMIAVRGRTGIRVIAAVIAVVTIGLVVLAIQMTIHREQQGDRIVGYFIGLGDVTLARVIGWASFLWWFGWSCFLTFIGPFAKIAFGGYYKHDFNDHAIHWDTCDHWAGFFACWGGVLCSWLCLEALGKPTHHDRDPHIDDQGGDSFLVRVMPLILASSAVQFLASIEILLETPGRRSTSGPKAMYSLIVSAVTISVLVVLSCCTLDRKRTLSCPLVFLFAILWTILAFLATLADWPCLEGHNWFWSAWVGCLLFGSELVQTFCIQRLSIKFSFSLDMVWSCGTRQG